jgi:hypothetical protein
MSDKSTVKPKRLLKTTWQGAGAAGRIGIKQREPRIKRYKVR